MRYCLKRWVLDRQEKAFCLGLLIGMMETLLNALEKNHALVAGEISSSTPPEIIRSSGVDFVTLYHTAELGVNYIAGFLPIGNTNDIIFSACMKLHREQIKVPVFSGICGSDPIQHFPSFFSKLKQLGIDGVQNFPSVGLIDDKFRYNLEMVNLGVERESYTFRDALSGGMDIMPFVYNQHEALNMAQIGAKIMILDLGLWPEHAQRWEQTEKYIYQINSTERIVHADYPDVKLLIYSWYKDADELLPYLFSKVERVSGIYKCIRFKERER